MNVLWYDYSPASLYVYREIRLLLDHLETSKSIAKELEQLPKHHMIRLAHDMPKRAWHDILHLRKLSVKQEIQSLYDFFKDASSPSAAAIVFCGYNDAPDLYFYRFVDHGIVFHHILAKLRLLENEKDVLDALKGTTLAHETITHFFDKLKPKNAAWSMMLEDKMKEKIAQDVEKTLQAMRLHVKGA